METPVNLNQIGLYNPQRQSDEVTKLLFVIRQKQFELLLNKIVQEKRNSIPQHYLIIGQRGMGKSSILKRIEVELRNEYHQQFIPLLFPEEQNNIRSLAEFWLNNLMVLIKSLKSENYPSEKLADIIKNRNDIAGNAPKVIAQEAYTYLMTVCQEVSRRPVLLVDNINFVFSRLEDKQEQWALRKLLSENGAPIVVGAGITVTDDVASYEMPFYDFFQIQYLRKLNYEEFEKLLKNLAIVTNSDEIVLSSMRENSSRQRSLFDLTGGSPRTTVMLFKHIIKGFSSDINDDLEILADEATPLYKAKFEELPKQQQIIIDAIAMNWDAISLNKLAKVTRYANNQLSPQLKRLIDDGWIETVVADKKSRKVLKETKGIIKGNAYLISERFFNIWYLIRYDIIKEGIYCLSKFLECLYEKEDLETNKDHDLIKLNSCEEAAVVYEKSNFISSFLNKAGFELSNQNKGLAKEYLLQAFDSLEKENKISSMANDYWWIRFGSVVIEKEYGSWLLEILEEKGYDIVLSPYYTAIQALEIEKQDSKNGKKDAEIYLNNRAVEISEPARRIVDKIRRYID